MIGNEQAIDSLVIKLGESKIQMTQTPARTQIESVYFTKDRQAIDKFLDNLAEQGFEVEEYM